MGVRMGEGREVVGLRRVSVYWLRYDRT
jgi:hypothetical protein